MEGNFKVRIVPSCEPLSRAQLDEYFAEFHGDSRYNVTANAVAAVPITALAEHRKVLQEVNYAYSHTLSIAPKASSQGHSGRCWMFAALNSMRYHVIKNLHLCDQFCSFLQHFTKSLYDYCLMR